jgi:hypothetical protein
MSKRSFRRSSVVVVEGGPEGRRMSLIFVSLDFVTSGQGILRSSAIFVVEYELVQLYGMVGVGICARCVTVMRLESI